MANSSGKVIFKSGIWYTISNLLVKGLAFITAPIFTRLLTKAEYGEYNNYSSWLNILTVVVGLSLHASLISARFDYEEKFDKYILSILSFQFVIAGFFLIVCNIFSDSVSAFLGMDIIYINVMIIYIIFMKAIEMFQEREKYRYNYKMSVAVSLTVATLSSALSVLFVILFSDRFAGRVIGATIPPVIIGIFIIIIFVVRGKSIDLSSWKYALPICLPYIPHLLSLTVLNTTDRIMIDKMCGSEETAMYSLAYVCGSMITLLQASLNSATSPWLGEKLHKKEYNDIKDYSYIFMTIFFVMSIGIMLIAPEILYILGGEPYMEAVYVLAPVCMGCICQFLYTMYVNIEQFEKKTGGMAIASVIAAVVNVVLNLLLIPQYGYLVAAYTTLVGFLILLAIHMYLVRRIGLSCVYDNKFVVAMVVVGIVLMIIIKILYSYYVIRYCVVLVYAIALIMFFMKNKNKILGFLKRE